MLLFLVLCPIVAAILIIAGAPARFSALVAAILNLVVTLALFMEFDRSAAGFQFVSSFFVSTDWGIHLAFGVDGLSLLMLLLAAIVTVAAIWFTGKIDNHENAFYACLLFISAGAIGAFGSIDLFFFYAFHELALIPTFLLIGIWGTGNRTRAAWKITIYLTVGSFILLIGLILLYQSLPPGARSFDLRGLQSVIAANKIAPAAQRDIYILLLVGFGILISLFPFHSWAPEAYASAPAPAAMLHAGVLKKFGLYGLLRLAIPMLPDGAQYWTQLLVILLIGNIIFIGLVTIAQKELDWMLGYSSVMHMGYIFLGIASANAIGTVGAAMLIFAHGLSIALLFAVAGQIRERTGTLAFSDLGGLAKVMPFAGLAFGFAAFAAIGLPGFANFASEIMIFFGAFRHGWEMQRFHLFQIGTVLALWGVVISTVYMLRAYRATFWGAMPERWNSLVDFGRGLRIPAAILIAGLICVGFFPQTVVNIITPVIRTYFVAAK
jgi:NADH-quinone oxidoreductase subunit M